MKKILTTFIFLFASINVVAEPIVIYDSKITIDANKFYPFARPNINASKLQQDIKKYKIKPNADFLIQQIRK